MQRDEALQRLPEAYAVALRLHAEGRDDAIAERLGITRESVGPLLRLAEAKLARLLGSSDVTESRSDQSGNE